LGFEVQALTLGVHIFKLWASQFYMDIFLVQNMEFLMKW